MKVKIKITADNSKNRYENARIGINIPLSQKVYTKEVTLKGPLPPNYELSEISIEKVD